VHTFSKYSVYCKFKIFKAFEEIILDKEVFEQLNTFKRLALVLEIYKNLELIDYIDEISLRVVDRVLHKFMDMIINAKE